MTPRTSVRVKNICSVRDALSCVQWSDAGVDSLEHRHLRSAIELASRRRRRAAHASRRSRSRRAQAVPPASRRDPERPRSARCAGRSRPTRRSAGAVAGAPCPSWSMRSAWAWLRRDDGWEAASASWSPRPRPIGAGLPTTSAAAARREASASAAEQAAVRARAELVAAAGPHRRGDAQVAIDGLRPTRSTPTPRPRRPGRELADARDRGPPRPRSRGGGARQAGRRSRSERDALASGAVEARATARRRCSPIEPSVAAERSRPARGRRAARAGDVGRRPRRPAAPTSSTSAPAEREPLPLPGGVARDSRGRPSSCSRRARRARRRLQRGQAGLAGRRLAGQRNLLLDARREPRPPFRQRHHGRVRRRRRRRRPRRQAPHGVACVYLARRRDRRRRHPRRGRGACRRPAASWSSPTTSRSSATCGRWAPTRSPASSSCTDR